MSHMWRVGRNEQGAPAQAKDGIQDAVSYAFTLLSQGVTEVVITAPNGRDVYVVRKLLT